VFLTIAAVLANYLQQRSFWFGKPSRTITGC
jgi:hypothetical protein